MSKLLTSLAASTLLTIGAGCFGNETTVFPEGFEPLDGENLAPPLALRADGSCEEGLTTNNSRLGRTYVTHGRGCIRRPLEAVYASLQVPEASWEPDAVNTFMVIRPAMQAECTGPYQTATNAGSPFSVDFRTCWRFSVVDGPGDPVMADVVAARWAKVWGTSAITSLEGSVVARRDPMDPDVTRVDVQYHLNAPSDAETVGRSVVAYFENWRAGSYPTQ